MNKVDKLFTVKRLANDFYRYRYFIGDNMPLIKPSKSFKGDKSIYKNPVNKQKSL